jgi:hypothetical protein
VSVKIRLCSYCVYEMIVTIHFLCYLKLKWLLFSDCFMFQKVVYVICVDEGGEFFREDSLGEALKTRRSLDITIQNLKRFK